MNYSCVIVSFDHLCNPILTFAKNSILQQTAYEGNGTITVEYRNILMSFSEFIFDTAETTFEHDVVSRSYEIPIVVDFWAPWCGPCRMVAPIVEEISKDFEGKIKVFKLNTDENPTVASQYGIRSIPTLMIFKGGQKVDTVVGAVPKATLSGTISKHL